MLHRNILNTIRHRYLSRVVALCSAIEDLPAFWDKSRRFVGQAQKRHTERPECTGVAVHAGVAPCETPPRENTPPDCLTEPD
jgi:hypothetical protein